MGCGERARGGDTSAGTLREGPPLHLGNPRAPRRARVAGRPSSPPAAGSFRGPRSATENELEIDKPIFGSSRRDIPSTTSLPADSLGSLQKPASLSCSRPCAKAGGAQTQCSSGGGSPGQRGGGQSWHQRGATHCLSEREKSRCAGTGPERTEQSPALNARSSLIKEKVRMSLFIYLQMCDMFVDETEQENKRTWNLTHD